MYRKISRAVDTRAAYQATALAEMVKEIGRGIKAPILDYGNVMAVAANLAAY
jgi:hypothetical protein